MGSLAVPLRLVGVVAAAVVAGFGLELFNVLWITVLQQRISDDVLARVNSYDALGSFVFIPLGLTIAGPVADAVGVSTALWGASFVALVTVLVPLLSRDVRTLRRVEAPLELPPLETEPTVPARRDGGSRPRRFAALAAGRRPTRRRSSRSAAETAPVAP